MDEPIIIESGKPICPKCNNKYVHMEQLGLDYWGWIPVACECPIGKEIMIRYESWE